MDNRFEFDWDGTGEPAVSPRPLIRRRVFFRHVASALGGCVLVTSRPLEALARASTEPAARARRCIFILMAGGPSHADTFDLKEGPWTPPGFQPESFGGLRFPRGLMPKIAAQLESIALVRSVCAGSAVHGQAQNRTLFEWTPEAWPGCVALSAAGNECPGGSDLYCRRAVTPADDAGLASLPALRKDERMRYGNGPFGDACLTARHLIQARPGAQFVEITMGGWDNHGDIYSGALNALDENSVARQFDAGLGTLLADLKSAGLLSETLVVAMGEFGRSVGPLNARKGRDHCLRQSVLVAGGGIRGGRAIGTTDAVGRGVIDYGWRANRDIRAEDIQATVRVALGTDGTSTRHGRERFRPLYELWS